ncbi:hypothetical protein PT974_09952 [Cladobotryum mycophilum]|uniref:Uncharacterized protein n=1 Tax=Cladobotryum mycophilum TaxID=491253 RepID=A0ABR0S8I5_9HYPO
MSNNDLDALDDLGDALVMEVDQDMLLASHGQKVDVLKAYSTVAMASKKRDSLY